MFSVLVQYLLLHVSIATNQSLSMSRSGLALLPENLREQGGRKSFNWIYDLKCASGETSLFNCNFDEFGAYKPCRFYFAAVRCHYDPEPLFLGYGGNIANIATAMLSGIDDQCRRIQLPIQIPICDQMGNVLHMCDNGVLKLEPLSGSGPRNMLKIYGTDIDLTQTGTVHAVVIYAPSVDTELEPWEQMFLGRVKNIINTRTRRVDIEPKLVAIITYDSVEPYTGSDSSTGNTATFQIVLFSNGTHTASFFLYGAMNWDDSAGHGIYVGVDAPVSSGQCNRRSDISFKPASLRIQNNVEAFAIPAMLFYDLTPGTQVSNYDVECQNWYHDNKKHVHYINKINRLMPPCPTNWEFIPFDPWFRTKYQQSPTDENVWCTTIIKGFWFIPHGKTCCYDKRNGRMAWSIREHGGFLQHHPEVDRRSNLLEDVKMRLVCCIQSNNCHLYRELRPLGFTYRKFPRRQARFFGDPHIVTLDGKAYTFNGHGEYILTDLVSGNYSFVLQGRTERARDKNNNLTKATIFSAFAAADSHGAKFMAQINNNRTGLIVYAGEEDLTLQYEDQGDEFEYSNGIINMYRNGSTLSVTFTSTEEGIRIDVTLALSMLQVAVIMPDKFNGQMKGLLGNNDGDKTNDFINANGTVLPDNSTEEQIFFDFGQSWYVNETTSVFLYWNNKDNAYYTDKSFVPMFLNRSDPLVINATAECGPENVACIIDLVNTGDLQVAKNTEQVEQSTELVAELIANEIPDIRGNVTVQSSMYGVVEEIVTADDDGLVTFVLSEETSPGVELLSRGHNQATVRWIHASTGPLTVGVFARDDKGVESPVHTFEIIFCTGCSGNGVCSTTLYDTRSTETFKYAKCECTSLWEGNDCEIDVDSCLDDPCGHPLLCVDHDPETQESTGNAFHCDGSCFDGFQLASGTKCIDINECSNGQPCTDGTCANTFGSFHCVCQPGYQLNIINKTVCEDTDECFEGHGGCQHICNNFDGGYNCSCHEGYMLNADGTTCDLVADVCASIGLTCDNAHGCTEIHGHLSCFCDIGYALDTDGQTCINVNECEQGLCMQACTDTEGSFTCSCFDGYKFDSDGKYCIECEYPYYGQDCSKTCACQYDSTCDHVKGCICGPGWTGSLCDKDVNECENQTICPASKKCVNYDGGYDCECVGGYAEDPSTGECTVDVDECSYPELNGCGNNICTNVEGGYYCTCQTGYIQNLTDFTTCIDIDECAIGRSGCEHKCNNSIGFFSCGCYDGYDLADDRRSCLKTFDFCQTYQLLACSHICKNTSAESCACPLGYTLALDQQTCNDIDECTDLEKNKCTQHCTNSPGSYECTCDIGFSLQNDQVTCTECDEYHYGQDCSSLCNCSAVGAVRCDKETGCICKTGFTGIRCETDIDECQMQQCPDARMTCENNPGSFACVCPGGYEIINGACSEIDECSKPTLNTCSQNCTNTDGSYVCSCFSGYDMDETGQCVDLDECAALDICDHHCLNLPGAFLCSCDPGFLLSVVDRKTCTDVDECELGLTVCEYPGHTCHNWPGGSACYCETGYKAATNSCSECDEFHYGLDCEDSCTCVTENRISCNKTTGACTCKPGWTGLDCETDIDECSLDPSLCSDVGQICVNTDASYYCDCDSGFRNVSTMTALVCTDIDECQEDTDGCDHICTNTEGGFDCSCEVGYSMNGKLCEACTGTAYGENCLLDCSCHSDGVKTASKPCDAVYGECICNDRWNGSQCEEDIDECLTGGHGCSKYSDCQNAPGTYGCNCWSYFNTVDNGRTCDLENSKTLVKATCNMKVKDSSIARKKRNVVTESDVKAALISYYSSILGSDLADVLIESFVQDNDRISVTYEVIITDSSSAITSTASAHLGLVTGSTIPLAGGLELEAEAIIVGETTVKSGDDTVLDDMICAVYIAINDQCPDGQVCQVLNNEPQCMHVEKEGGTSNKALIIGLTVGIGTAALVIMAFLIYRIKKRGSVKERHLRSFGSRSTLSTRQLVTPAKISFGWEDKFAFKRSDSRSTFRSASSISPAPSFYFDDNSRPATPATPRDIQFSVGPVSPSPSSQTTVDEKAFFPYPTKH